jgi:uncharacterized RDD family membrane protein YckC
MRFDEVELAPVVFDLEEPEPAAPAANARVPAARWKRLLTLLTDVSLFVALALAMSPVLPVGMNAMAIAALVAFVVLLSFYYFVGSWMLWGKTIGGIIFGVKIIPIGATAMTFKQAAKRWVGFVVSLAAGGLGFALAILPSRLSLSDRLSATCCVSAA